MVKRLIVHAGFHKTGTTTIQNTLAAYSHMLEAQIVLRADMGGLCEAARSYSTSRTDLDLGLVAYEAARLAEDWRADTVLMSSEDLSGHMPGRHGLTDYSAAAPLAATMVQTWRTALPGLHIDWVCSTRSPAPWLASCHVQHLRAARMRLSAKDYADTYAGSADLAGIVQQVRTAVTGADVHSFALEDHRADLLAPLLDLANIPAALRTRIQPLPAANPSPGPDKVAAMLDINRSDMTDAEVRAAQNALHRRAR